MTCLHAPVLDHAIYSATATHMELFLRYLHLRQVLIKSYDSNGCTVCDAEHGVSGLKASGFRNHILGLRTVGSFELIRRDSALAEAGSI